MQRVHHISILSGICLLLALCNGLSASAQSIDEFSLMTENYPPFNFEQDNRLQGISVDLMVAILERMGSQLTRENIQLLPWARAYKWVQTRPNTALFCMTRTAEREELFKWVGPVIASKMVLIAPKSLSLSLATLEEARDLQIGVVLDDVVHQMLTEAGFEDNIHIVSGINAPSVIMRMLNAGRLDLWGYEESVAKWLLKQEGFQPEEYEVVYVLQEMQDYFAFHTATPDTLIQELQQHLDVLKQSGEYDRIVNRYLK